MLTLELVLFMSLILPQAFFGYYPEIGTYLIIITISYFVVTLIFRTRRRAPDVVGIGLLVVSGYLTLAWLFQ